MGNVFRSPTGAPVVSGLKAKQQKPTVAVCPKTGCPPIARAKVSSLGVVTCHFNPCGYKTPIENYQRFADGLRSSGTPLYTIELVFDDAEPQTKPDILIRGDRREHCLWQKERLLNILIQQIADDHDAIAWVDADILFVRPDWTRATMRCLERHAVMQPFDQSYQALPNGQLKESKKSTGCLYATRPDACVEFGISHPGFAWAGRSQWLKKHGLLDTSVTGSGDLQMITGFIGQSLPINSRIVGTGWLRSVQEWALKVHPEILASLGFIDGSVIHLFHGTRENRQYQDRWEWLIRDSYEPVTDIETCPETGLIRWTEHAKKFKPRMIQSVFDYFESRREDG